MTYNLSVEHLIFLNVLIILTYFTLWIFIVNKDKSKNKDKTEREERFQDLDINPELPFSSTHRHFCLGGFCMQWGTSEDTRITRLPGSTNFDWHRVIYDFPFDFALATYITPKKKDNHGRTNVKIQEYAREYFDCLARVKERPFSWLAIGLKITPIQ